MKRIYYNLGCKDELSEICPRGAVYALGFFDGVHLAHRALINEARAIADELDLPLGVFTFSSESPGIKPGAERIYSTEDKLSVIEGLGVHFAVICNFEELRGLAPVEFAELLCVELRLRCGVCGFNFRFGKGALGDSEELCRLFSQRGCSCKVIDEISLLEASVSASRIRELIKMKKPAEAAKLLGLPYFVCGEVIHGRGQGRDFGFPTINTDFEDGALIPHDGVYLTAVKIGERIFTGITNVGMCPTFGCKTRHAETYIIDFTGDLYGSTVKIHFVEFLRDERVFGSTEELKEQLKKDCERAKSLASEELWQEIGLK